MYSICELYRRVGAYSTTIGEAKSDAEYIRGAFFYSVKPALISAVDESFVVGYAKQPTFRSSYFK